MHRDFAPNATKERARTCSLHTAGGCVRQCLGCDVEMRPGISSPRRTCESCSGSGAAPEPGCRRFGINSVACGSWVPAEPPLPRCAEALSFRRSALRHRCCARVRLTLCLFRDARQLYDLIVAALRGCSLGSAAGSEQQDRLEASRLKSLRSRIIAGPRVCAFATAHCYASCKPRQRELGRQTLQTLLIKSACPAVGMDAFVDVK